jgi:hypothetical protein
MNVFQVELVNKAEVERALSAFSQNFETTMHNIVSNAQHHFVENVARYSGSRTITESIKVSYFEGSLTAEITSPVALYKERGTRPHKIRPRFMRALYWSGASSPVASVNHPGTQAEPFFAKACETTLLQVKSDVTEALGRLSRWPKQPAVSKQSSTVKSAIAKFFGRRFGGRK